MSKNFDQAVQERRTYYSISKQEVIPEQEIIKIVNHAVKNAPSAFNSQGARVLVLFGAAHDTLWNFTKEILRGVVPADGFASTEAKINSFGAGYGTILYFEDQSTVEGLQSRFPLYKDNFPVWSQQSSGMLQYIIWTALENEGLGVSLQHYNPLIDEKTKSTWGIPDNWKLIAEMPFGKPTANPDEKTFLPLEERVKVAK